jgi:putative nucleotidyltransferase with HDIG domain
MRKSFFGSHLYSQIVVPFILALILVAVIASMASLYFLNDISTRWTNQVAGAATAVVVQHWREIDRTRAAYADLFASDEGAAADADRRDLRDLASEVASDAAFVPDNSNVAIVDLAGNVVAAGGLEAPVVGTQVNVAIPSNGATDLPVVYRPGAGRSESHFVSSLRWLGSARHFVILVSTPVQQGLLADSSNAILGGFSFYDLKGDRLATVVSSALSTQAAGSLRASLGEIAPAIAAGLKGAPDGAQVVGSFVSGGVPYRYVLQRAGDPAAGPQAADGYVLGAISEAEARSASGVATTAITLWSIFAVGALVGLGFWVARRVSVPLVDLTAGARRIADGDFSTKVDARSRNELGVLAETFNDMTDSLRERSEALTKKVLELAMLYEMSRALGATLDMDDLLGSSLDSALRIFDLDVGYVALRDRDSGGLRIRAVRGAEQLRPLDGDAARSSMAEWVVREGRPLIFNPDPGAVEAQIDVLTGAKAALCVPLVSAEGTIGAIAVGSSDAEYRFNGDDVRLLSTIGNHVTIAIGNIELFTSLQEAYFATVRSLAAAVDAKDTYTRGHSDKVAMYAAMIAQRMNLSHDQITALEMAAYLHDIGKIGVPEHILLKPGRLDEGEMEQMRHHPLIGANILKPVAFPWAITPIVRHHHECWDGKGYPAGLKGEEIPLLARILCVADSYEAMTADRPYRAGRSPADAAAELRSCAGTQFDPRVVELMLSVVGELERASQAKLAQTAEIVSAEEARAIFAALVDGVLSSFRRLGGPRLASNIEGDVDEYFRVQNLPYRMVRGRLTFLDQPNGEVTEQLLQMRSALHHVEATIGRVSGNTLVQHFYDDALESFSSRMRQLAITLEFASEE